MHLQAKKLIKKIVRDNPDYKFLREKTRIETETVITVLCKTVETLIDENAALKKMLEEALVTPEVEEIPELFEGTLGALSKLTHLKDTQSG